MALNRRAIRSMMPSSRHRFWGGGIGHLVHGCIRGLRNLRGRRGVHDEVVSLPSASCQFFSTVTTLSPAMVTCSKYLPEPVDVVSVDERDLVEPIGVDPHSGLAVDKWFRLDNKVCDPRGKARYAVAQMFQIRRNDDCATSSVRCARRVFNVCGCRRLPRVTALPRLKSWALYLFDRDCSHSRH